MTWLEKIINQSKTLVYKSIKNSIKLQSTSSINKSKIHNNIIGSKVLFCIYILNLISMLIHKNLNYMKVIRNNESNEIVISIIYYSNLVNIIRDFLMKNDNISYVLYLAVFYISIFIIIIIKKVLYSSKYLCTNYTNVLSVFHNMVCMIKQSYIWLLNLPTANIIALILNHINKLIPNLIILFIIICFLILFIHILIYYTECDLNFIPNNPLNVRFSHLLEFIIIEHYILSFLVYSNWINHFDEFIPIICIIFALIKLYIAWKHIPFTHPSISKLFFLSNGYYLIMCIDLLIIHYIHINSNIQYSLTMLLIIEIPVVTFTLLYLWKKLTFTILYAKSDQLSNTLFDFQMRIIIEALKECSQNKKRSTLILEMFLSNHKSKCFDELCICQDSNLLRNVDLNNENVLEKTRTTLIKKDLILNLISKDLQYKINKPNNETNRNSLKLIYTSFLIWCSQDYFKVYQITSSIIQSDPSYIHKYNAFIIKTNMETNIKKKRLELNNELYLIKIIGYYQRLNNFKSLLYLFFKKYHKLLKIISNPIINLNDVLAKGKIILKQKDQLLKIIYRLQEIYETTTEFYTLINLYSQFGFIDPITTLLEKHKQEPKIWKYSKKNIINIIDPLNSDSCAIISEYFIDKNMKLSKTTPNFYKIFGYENDFQDITNILISQLMPKIMGQYHDIYIGSFVSKSNCFINYSIIDNLPAIDAQGYVFTAKVKSRFDFFNGKAYLVGLLQRYTQDKELILLDESNHILSYSCGLSEIFIDLNTISQLPIGLFIPRFLLNPSTNNRTHTELYDIYQTKGLFDAQADITQNANDDDAQFVYLIVPNSINQLVKVKSILTKSNNESYVVVLNLAKMMYITQEESSFSIYKAYLQFKEYKFNDKRISLRSITLSNIKLVHNNRAIISIIQDFIQNLIELSPTFTAKRLTIMTKIKLIKNSISSYENSSHHDRHDHHEHHDHEHNDDNADDLSDENGLKDIFPQNYSIERSPTKRLTFYGSKVMDERIYNSKKSTSLNFRQFDPNDNPNNPNNNPNFSSISILPPFPSYQKDYKSLNTLNNIICQYQDQNHNFALQNNLQNQYQHQNPQTHGYNESMDKLNITIQNTLKLPSYNNNNSRHSAILNDDDNEDYIIRSNNYKQNIIIKHCRQDDKHRHDNNNAKNIITKRCTLKTNKKKPTNKINRSNQSSLSSGTSFKAFIALLNRKISIKQLDWLNYFGIVILITMLIILLTLSLILKSNIDKYTIYVYCSDYPNLMLTSIAVYGQYLIQYDFINHDLINRSDTNLTLLSSSMLTKMYGWYKEKFENAVFKQQIFEKAYTLYYGDFEMDLMLYTDNNNSIEMPIITEYYSGVLYMMEMLYEINENNSTLMQYPYLHFIFRNFPEYFSILMENTWDISDEAYGYDAKIDIENFAVNMLIYCLISTFSFVVLIYPIYYSIETKQKHGISLISTISASEIIKINTLIENLQVYTTKNQISKTSGQIIAKKKSVKMNALKTIRQWHFKRFNSIIFLAILAVFYGIWSTYFSVQTAMVIRENTSFKQYYYEFDFITDVLSGVNSEFYMTWITFYLQNHEENRKFYFDNYQYTKNIFQDRLNTFIKFWTDIDQYLSNNTEMTDFYQNTHLFIKEEDLCLYINSYLQTQDELTKCQIALNGAMQNGILKTILTLTESLIYRIRIPTEEEFNLDNIIQIVKSPFFNEINKIQEYIIYFFEQYINDIKLNLYIVLDNNLKSIDIFLGLGIFIFIGSFWIFWIPFVYHLRKELNYVKQIYCCLPASAIMNNPYVKKWLNDNSLNI